MRPVFSSLIHSQSCHTKYSERNFIPSVYLDLDRRLPRDFSSRRLDPDRDRSLRLLSSNFSSFLIVDLEDCLDSSFCTEFLISSSLSLVHVLQDAACSEYGPEHVVHSEDTLKKIQEGIVRPGETFYEVEVISAQFCRNPQYRRNHFMR